MRRPPIPINNRFRDLFPVFLGQCARIWVAALFHLFHGGVI